MAYAICRVGKIKTTEGLAGSEGHTNRSQNTPNANPARTNERLFGEPGEGLVNLVLEKIGDQTIRKNAVLCVEFLLSASPEFFRPDESSRAGYWELEKLDQWKAANRDWLVERYAKNLIRAELHLDEATPHIHAYVVPLDQKEKLNCRAFLGGRKEMVELQTDYARAMEPLGLERGIQGSRAKHEDIQRYYGRVERTLQRADQVVADVEKMSLDEIKHRLEEAVFLAEQNARLLEQNRVENSTSKSLAAKLERSQKIVKILNERANLLDPNAPKITIGEVAAALGFVQNSDNEKLWVSGEKRIWVDRNMVFDDQKRQIRTVIDLVQWANKMDYPAAVAWMNAKFTPQRTRATVDFLVDQISLSQQLSQKNKGEKTKKKITQIEHG